MGGPGCRTPPLPGGSYPSRQPQGAAGCHHPWKWAGTMNRAAWERLDSGPAARLLSSCCGCFWLPPCPKDAAWGCRAPRGSAASCVGIPTSLEGHEAPLIQSLLFSSQNEPEAITCCFVSAFMSLQPDGDSPSVTPGDDATAAAWGWGLLCAPKLPDANIPHSSAASPGAPAAEALSLSKDTRSILQGSAP